MAKRIFIEGRRNGYTPSQCGKTMTVAELQSFLDQFDEDAEVYISNDRGYTYGNIDEWSFEEPEEDEDGDI